MRKQSSELRPPETIRAGFSFCGATSSAAGPATPSADTVILDLRD